MAKAVNGGGGGPTKEPDDTVKNEWLRSVIKPESYYSVQIPKSAVNGDGVVEEVSETVFFKSLMFLAVRAARKLFQQAMRMRKMWHGAQLRSASTCSIWMCGANGAMIPILVLLIPILCT